jgi:hypothetical protein
MHVQISESFTHLFDESVQLTNMTEYGISWSDLVSRKVAPPAEGARFDIYFEGDVTGEKLNGRIRGVDFLEVRADGRFMLNIQATIITDDGETIALQEAGVLRPGSTSGESDIRFDMKFTAHSAKYKWLNTTPVLAFAKVDHEKGMVRVSAFEPREIAVLN